MMMRWFDSDSIQLGIDRSSIPFEYVSREMRLRYISLPRHSPARNLPFPVVSTSVRCACMYVSDDDMISFQKTPSQQATTLAFQINDDRGYI
jgi:hypothetical protein